MILIGNIVNTTNSILNQGTDYTVNVEKYIKGNLNQKILKVSGLGRSNGTIMSEDEPIFSQGDRVIFYLTIDKNNYHITPYSHLLQYK